MRNFHLSNIFKQTRICIKYHKKMKEGLPMQHSWGGGPISWGRKSTTSLPFVDCRSRWLTHSYSTCRPSLLWALLSAFWWPFILTGVAKGVNSVFLFSGPVVLYFIIRFVEQPGEPLYYGDVIFTTPPPLSRNTFPKYRYFRLSVCSPYVNSH